MNRSTVKRSSVSMVWALLERSSDFSLYPYVKQLYTKAE